VAEVARAATPQAVEAALPGAVVEEPQVVAVEALPEAAAEAVVEEPRVAVEVEVAGARQPLRH
jgi:hypothetical protein